MFKRLKTKEDILKTQKAYQMVFNHENVFLKDVLEDLANFCRANESTFHTDDRIHAALEGRREVWLRILEHTKMSPDQIWETYIGKGEKK